MAESVRSSPSTTTASFATATGTAITGTPGSRSAAASPDSPPPPRAAEVKAHGGEYPWSAASARRDYMIVREGLEYPDDGGHVKALEWSGCTVLRGTARLAGPGTVIVTHDATTHELAARDVIIAVGS